METGIPVRRILAVRTTAGSGQAAVRSGEHALSIAKNVALLIKKSARGQPGAKLHIFTSAPNALVFFLGQRLANASGVSLYEYDFEKTRGGGYVASLALPIPSVSG